MPDDVVQPLVERVMGAPAEQLMKVSEITAFEVPHAPHSFSGFVCDRCGEMTVEGYGRPLGDQTVCQPCHDAALGSGE